MTTTDEELRFDVLVDCRKAGRCLLLLMFSLWRRVHGNVAYVRSRVIMKMFTSSHVLAVYLPVFICDKDVYLKLNIGSDNCFLLLLLFLLCYT